MSQMLQPDIPYNDLPLLPPAKDLESIAVLKKTVSATRALARLKGVGRNIPNQSILVNAISLQEAKLSSEIENIFTTNDELYQAFNTEDASTNPHTKEVLRYQEALWYGYNTLKDKPVLTTNLFIRLAQLIKENQAAIRTTPGTRIIRDDGQVVYTPPEGETTLRNLLHNLEIYIHQSDDVDPLIKLGVIHYQFEAIHPFSDGNGRTGRIINILYLVQQGLIDLPIMYLSKYMIEHKSEYYRLLKGVTEEGNWESWILYVLDAVEKMADYTHDKIESIYQLMERTAVEIQQVLPHLYSKELVELIFFKPFCKIKFLEEAGIAKRKTASNYLHEMEEKGILQSKRVGKEKLFINTHFYDVLKS